MERAAVGGNGSPSHPSAAAGHVAASAHWHVVPHDGSADSADISLGRGVPFQPIEGPASNTAGRAFSQCTSEGIGKLGRRSVVIDLSHSIAGTSVNTRAFNQVARQSVC